LTVQLLDVLRAFRRRGFVALGDMSQPAKILGYELTFNKRNLVYITSWTGYPEGTSLLSCICNTLCVDDASTTRQTKESLGRDFERLSAGLIFPPAKDVAPNTRYVFLQDGTVKVHMYISYIDLVFLGGSEGAREC